MKLILTGLQTLPSNVLGGAEAVYFLLKAQQFWREKNLYEAVVGEVDDDTNTPLGVFSTAFKNSPGIHQ